MKRLEEFIEMTPTVHRQCKYLTGLRRWDVCWSPLMHRGTALTLLSNLLFVKASHHVCSLRTAESVQIFCDVTNTCMQTLVFKKHDL